MTVPFPLPDITLTAVRAAQVRDVLRQMTGMLEKTHAVDSAAMAQLLMDAETTGGSAIGDGIAVISARVPVDVAPRRLCAFARLERPLAFRGVETHPCDIVYMMVTPEHEAQAHLRDLSAIIRALRDRDFVARLREADTPERVANLFRARDMALTRAA
ncbi:MAG: PTS sugar transporter subunit IIA [Rhodospirillales bacterium]|nr:PTS sugar transporter subunit IIA [Alphaproteobacteria bacterium]MCB9986890.1 PTS sugar transporter subunit IIA [Rhodospirillales bacterium]USO08332.1 MAG: PTS sugar transporter subunit IIA [Rhodospirillales bacterium]